MKACVVVALLMIPAILAAESHTWETAKVLSQNLSSQRAGAYAVPIGNGTVAVPLYQRQNSVVVETDRYQYEWQEVGSGSAIILPVNDTIRFYRDKDWFVVLDSKNKKHKFSLVGAVKKD